MARADHDDPALEARLNTGFGPWLRLALALLLPMLWLWVGPDLFSLAR
ncbi:MAG TPA: hypothetical protein VFM16_09350 [Holophagaceae bacterium]|nr:hypothetical protein [Holophagaceae bacterium]